MGHFWLLLQLYGGVYNLFRSGLPRMGIDVTMVDIFDLNDLKKCLRSQTKLVWLEACTNPLVMLADLGRDHLLSFWRSGALVYNSSTEIWSICNYFNKWQHSLVILTARLYFYWSNQKYVQVNLCQKLFFLQNMRRTCCVHKLFWMSKTISVHNMFSPCSAKIRASDKDLPVP